MIISRRADGKWLLKRKFTFAAITGTLGTLHSVYGMYVAATPEEVVAVFEAWSSFCMWLLGLVFAADVSDKWLNGGKYNDED